MPVLFTNNASGALAASISSAATTIVLAAGQGVEFPSPAGGSYFYATLTDTNNNLEIVKVTARLNDTLTVVRGQDGTSARAYGAGDLLELRPVAAAFADMQYYAPSGNIAANYVQAAIAELDAEKAGLALNNTFSGNNTFNGTLTASGGGTITGSYAGNHTYTGNLTFSGTSLFANDNVRFQRGIYVGSNLDKAFYYDVAQTAAYVQTGNSLGYKFFKFADNGDFTVQNGNLSVNAGNITASGNITSNSDARLKSDVRTISNALQIVKALRGTAYVKDGKASIGLIAQEVEKVLPQVVEEGANGYLSVAYGNLVSVLIEAVKELSAKVEEIERK